MFIIINDPKDINADTLKTENILYSLQKEDLQRTAKKVDAYFTPRHDKARLTDSILDMVRRYPENLLSVIPKTEYPLLIELVEETDPTKYAVRPIRKTSYALMNMGLVVTYVDQENKKWHILMPTELKEILRNDLPLFKSVYEQGLPIPKGKEARFMVMMNEMSKAKKPADRSTDEEAKPTKSRFEIISNSKFSRS